MVSESVFTYGMRVHLPQSYSKLDYTIDDLQRLNLEEVSSLNTF